LDAFQCHLNHSQLPSVLATVQKKRLFRGAETGNIDRVAPTSVGELPHFLGGVLNEVL
jgi:hypothetical protein